MSEHREREDELRYQRYEEGLDPWGYPEVTDEYAPAQVDAFQPVSSVDRPAPLNVWRCQLCLEYKVENHCDCGGVVEREAA